MWRQPRRHRNEAGPRTRLVLVRDHGSLSCTARAGAAGRGAAGRPARTAGGTHDIAVVWRHDDVTNSTVVRPGLPPCDGAGLQHDRALVLQQ